MSEGVKFDGEKPWAGTVLAGHWPELHHSAMDVLGVAKWELEVLTELLDSNVTYQARLANAAKELTRKRHKDWLPFVVQVGNFGAHKPEYGPDNWLSLKNGSRRCYEAAGRHVMDWFCGASTDAHSGFHQRGHIWWNILSGAVHARREACVPEMNAPRIARYGSLLGVTVDGKAIPAEDLAGLQGKPLSAQRIFRADGTTDLVVGRSEEPTSPQGKPPKGWEPNGRWS